MSPTLDAVLAKRHAMPDKGRFPAVLVEAESAPLSRATFTKTGHAEYSQGVGTIRASGGDVGGGSETIVVDSNVVATHEPIAFHPTQVPISSVGISHCLGTGCKGGQATCAVTTALSVRRLTPIECERLQGFPDDWTLVPHRGKAAADGPRYKAIGNSMAVPVVRWIGERIAAVDKVTR
jgi:DNA (cytosine-5)-methyltransferase 1